jgi:hypothetical protein
MEEEMRLISGYLDLWMCARLLVLVVVVFVHGPQTGGRERATPTTPCPTSRRALCALEPPQPASPSLANKQKGDEDSATPSLLGHQPLTLAATSPPWIRVHPSPLYVFVTTSFATVAILLLLPSRPPATFTDPHPPLPSWTSLYEVAS